MTKPSSPAVHLRHFILRKLMIIYLPRPGGGDLASPHPRVSTFPTPVHRLSRLSLSLTQPLVSLPLSPSCRISPLLTRAAGRRMQPSSPPSPLAFHSIRSIGAIITPFTQAIVVGTLVCTSPTPRQTESEKRADPRLSKRYTSSDQKRPDVDRSEGYRSIQTWKGASIRVSSAPYLTRIDLKQADFQVPTS
jgi:hypothetical protein